MVEVSYNADGVFYFNIGYYDEGGSWWGYDRSENNDNLETFTLTSAASASSARIVMSKAPDKSLRHPQNARLGRCIKGKPQPAFLY